MENDSIILTLVSCYDLYSSKNGDMLKLSLERKKYYNYYRSVLFEQRTLEKTVDGYYNTRIFLEKILTIFNIVAVIAHIFLLRFTNFRFRSISQSNKMKFV